MTNPSPMFARRLVSAYLVVQAASTLIWWVCLVAMPSTRKWFQPDTWPDAALLSFWLPDLAIIVVGSSVVAWSVLVRKRWASLGIWSLAGAAWYATLYCIGCSVTTGQAWLASAMMCSMSGLTLAMATIHGQPEQSPATFRTIPMPPLHALAWSLLQLVIFWGIFLWILPMALLELQQKVLGIEPFAHLYQRPLSVVLFLLASALGMSSCFAIALRGEGTPLPTANAPKLVVVGTYRWVRNPMALAGIVQGAAVGWMLGSWLVIGYALTGACLWHICVRPVEEAEMATRFGTAYDDYRKSVGLWIPRLFNR